MPFNEHGKKPTACCNKKEQTVILKSSSSFQYNLDHFVKIFRGSCSFPVIVIYFPAGRTFCVLRQKLKLASADSLHLCEKEPNCKIKESQTLGKTYTQFQLHLQKSARHQLAQRRKADLVMFFMLFRLSHVLFLICLAAVVFKTPAGNRIFRLPLFDFLQRRLITSEGLWRMPTSP